MSLSTLKTTLKDFHTLTKFRLSFSNTVVAMAPYLYFCPELDFKCGAFATATLFMAMSTQIANQRIEIESDRQMIRTCERPLPQNRISSDFAISSAVGLFAASNAIFATMFPLPALGIANLISISYILIYTPLKKFTPWNTAVGAVIGALPPLLGAAAAGMSILEPFPFFTSLYVFAWQFPHFYGILFTHSSDYKKAGYMMEENKKRASVLLVGSSLLKFISVVGLGTVMELNLFNIVTLAMSAYLVKTSVIPTYEFTQLNENSSEEEVKKRARKMLRTSFRHFLVFYAILYGEVIYQLFNGKKEKKNLEECKSPIIN